MYTLTKPRRKIWLIVAAKTQPKQSFLHPPSTSFHSQWSGWDAGSPKRWDRSHFSPPRFGKDYKWYISGIFPANWGMDYATYLPPFRGTSIPTLDSVLIEFCTINFHEVFVAGVKLSHEMDPSKAKRSILWSPSQLYTFITFPWHQTKTSKGKNKNTHTTHNNPAPPHVFCQSVQHLIVLGPMSSPSHVDVSLCNDFIHLESFLPFLP